MDVTYIKTRHVFVTPEGDFTPQDMIATYVDLWYHADEQANIIAAQKKVIHSLRVEVNQLKKADKMVQLTMWEGEQ